MVKDYHKNIQYILSDLCKENNDRFKKGFVGNRKIDINHPTKKNKSIIYYPDFVIIAKNGNYYIFQILDSQDDIQALTIANVIEAYLSEQVRKLFFIVKDIKVRNKVNEITETILAKIEDLTSGTIRNPLKVFYIPISEKESKESIIKILKETILNISDKVDENIRETTSSKLGEFVLSK